jgi:hypothetical protein
MGRKHFFFEKKKRKTFARWHPHVPTAAAKLIKVSCFFFPKKKAFLSYSGLSM